MTIMECPHGCGGVVDTGAKSNCACMAGRCPSCRRELNTVEIQLPGTCWQWWGDSWHRMRCRKMAGHSGAHSTHNDCGANDGHGMICGFEPDHAGPHGWESRALAGEG